MSSRSPRVIANQPKQRRSRLNERSRSSRTEFEYALVLRPIVVGQPHFAKAPFAELLNQRPSGPPRNGPVPLLDASRALSLLHARQRDEPFPESPAHSQRRSPARTTSNTSIGSSLPLNK